MATQSNQLAAEELQRQFAQNVRASFPFNPLGGLEIAGANLSRLQKTADSFGWTDPRFVTAEQAIALGWTIKNGAQSVALEVTDPSDGSIDTRAVFNAMHVEGIPDLVTMFAMSHIELKRMQEQAAESQMPDEIAIGPARELARENDADTPKTTNTALVPLQPGFKRLISHGAAPYEHDPAKARSYFVELEDAKGAVHKVWGLDLERSLEAACVTLGDPIALIRNGSRQVEIDERQRDGSVLRKTVERVNWDTAKQIEPPQQAVTSPSPQDDLVAAQAGAPAAAVDQGPQRFAALAPYWYNKLHNHEGLALAQKINDAIKQGKLAQDKEAIQRLLDVYPKASALGIKIVAEAQYLNDPHLRADMARPVKLLGGALVRDKEGVYRPAAGGRPVVHDQNDSIVLKSKDNDAYRGAMELAAAKGWTAIELKGKPAMMANAWLEAKMMGLDVVNYSPTEKDLANYHARVAEEAKRKAAEQADRPAEQAPEQVEVRPFIDANGEQKTATVTYTVYAPGGAKSDFDNAKDAAKAFSMASQEGRSVVIRSVTRVDGLVSDEVVARNVQGVSIGAIAQTQELKFDHEFNEAMEELKTEEKAVASLNTPAVVSTGSHIGPIVEIKDGHIAQKSGRDPTKLVWHDLSKLSGPMPRVGEMAEINYAKEQGVVKSYALQQGVESAGLSMER